MTRDEAVALIAFRLGNRSDLDTAIVRELRYQQRELENKPSLPWFLLSEVSTAATEVGEERVPLPTDFLREPEEESALWRFAAEAEGNPWTEIKKSRFDKARLTYYGSGAPMVYSIIGGYFRLLPTPDAIYSLKMIYYRRGLELGTNIENEWLKEASGVLVGAAGMALAGAISNPSALAQFQSEFTLANNNLTIQNTARQEANRSRIMGEQP